MFVSLLICHFEAWLSVRWVNIRILIWQYIIIFLYGSLSPSKFYLFKHRIGYYSNMHVIPHNEMCCHMWRKNYTVMTLLGLGFIVFSWVVILFNFRKLDHPIKSSQIFSLLKFTKKIWGICVQYIPCWIYSMRFNSGNIIYDICTH